MKKRVKKEIWNKIVDAWNTNKSRIDIPYAMISSGKEYIYHISYGKDMFLTGDVVEVVPSEAGDGYYKILPSGQWTILEQHLEEIYTPIVLPKKLFEIEE